MMFFAKEAHMSHHSQRNHQDDGEDIGTYQRNLQTILDQVTFQSCENERFCQTVRALESQYRRRMYAIRQLIQQLDRTLIVLDEQRLGLHKEHEQVEGHLKELEVELPMTQRLAIERQRKRSNRQRRYDRYYRIPLLARRCRARYMRARDKHAVAEHRVAQIREALEVCQDASGRIRYALDGLKQEYNHAASRRHDIAKELVAVQETLDSLLDRRQFWCDFEASQVRMVTEAVQRSMPPDVQAPSMESWLKRFQMACVEYGECLAVGKERWGPVAVEFDCIVCNSIRYEWPSLTTQGLICKQCLSRSSVPTQGQRQKLPDAKNKVFPSEALATGISLKHRLVSTVLCKVTKSRLINRSSSKNYI